MANERIPADPYRADPYRAGTDRPDLDRPIVGDEPMIRDDLTGRPTFDDELQPDPELAEGRTSGGKIALFAVCVALVLGAVFYGLNNSNINQASTAPPAQTAQTQPATPQAPPGVRDVTPKTNDQPGMTTGAAPSRPTPPASAPTGTEADKR